MAHKYHHAVSSARRFGGVPEDYEDFHAWFDQTKQVWSNYRHRAVLHSAFGVFLAEEHFGILEENRQLRRLSNWLPRWLQRLLHVPQHRPSGLRNSAGRVVPFRVLGEQHCLEDHGRIPSLQEWLQEVPAKAWMGARAEPLSKILKEEHR